MVAIRGELGMWTLRARRDLKKLLYCAKILTLPDDRLVKQTFIMSKKSKLKRNWAGRTYGLEFLWENERIIWNLDGHNNLRIEMS